MKIKEKEAVSPVIGVILMVAITVVLAAVLYVWVSGYMGGGGGMTPTAALTAPPEVKATGEAEATTTRVISISAKTPPGKIEWFVYDPAGLKVAGGEILSGESTSDNNVSVQLIDNDGDDKVTTNDVIKIWATSQDGVKNLEAGKVFALIYTDTSGEIARTTFT